MDYTNRFNENSDRRRKNLPFIGEERRFLMKEQFRIQEEKRQLEAFLNGLHMIPDISKVTKNVNGSV
ncbi:MAG: hypothetical protein AAF569_09515 [Pseudomonadota bacterium]